MKSLFKAVKNIKRLSLGNQRGQGVIEYTLVLMVVVGVVLGGLYQLNQAFQVFADNYFGDYLACLLETGELPALDGRGGTCNASFQAFSLANGRPEVTLSGSASGGVGGGVNPGSSAAANAAAAAAAAGRSNTFFVGLSNTPPPAVTIIPISGAGAGKGGSDTGDFSTTDLAGYEGAKVIRIPLRRSERGIAGAGYQTDEDKDKQKIKVTATAQGLAAEKRNELMKVIRKTASEKAPDIEEFTFSNFLRYLIIAAIVIAILFFIGSQAMQVSKSLE